MNTKHGLANIPWPTRMHLPMLVAGIASLSAPVQALADIPSHLQEASSTPWVRSTADAGYGYDGIRYIGGTGCGPTLLGCYEDASVSASELSTTTLVNTDVFAQVSSNKMDLILDSANASSRAKTMFGANLAKVASQDNVEMTFRLYIDSNGPDVEIIYGESQAWATAQSEYNDPFKAIGSGLVTFNFNLKRHAPTVCPTGLCFLGGYSSPVYTVTHLDGDASGFFYAQLFDLTAPHIQYCTGGDADEGSAPYCETGPVLVGTTTISLPDTPGNHPVSFSATLADGSDYALIVGLWMTTGNNSQLDMYGTVSLSSILVEPGMSLSFMSGSSYNVVAIPEPETYALMLAGLGLVGWAARRRLR